MWWEWLERLMTTCPSHLRDMGLLREMLGIRQRWRKYQSAWQPHCDRSRALIVDAMKRCPRRRRALILGSGWLHDVPLAELQADFAEVTLVDLFHPWRTRWLVRHLPNVHLVEGDVTGALQAVHAASRVPNSPLPRVEPTLFLDEEIDLVVSCNLLSQLPCMVEWYLRRLSRDEAAIFALAQNLIEAHLDYLKKFSAVVAVITDVALEWVDAHGQVTHSCDTLYCCSLPYHGETWTWDLVAATPAQPGQRLRVVGAADIRSVARGT